MNSRLRPRFTSATRACKPLAVTALRCVAPVAVAFAVLTPLTATHAAEMTFAPDIRVGGHYDDNARLSEGNDQIKISGAFADLAALAQWRTPTSTVQVRPRFFTSLYPGDEDEESDDAYLDFSARNAGQRTRWALVGNYAREQVIRGERDRLDFADPDIDRPDGDTTGLVNERRRRTLWRLAPSVSYELSERNDIGAGLSYSDVEFSPQQPGEALDYTDGRVEVFFAQDLSPTSRLRTTAFASSYEVDEIDNDSTGYGVRARYERDITEVYDVHLDVGIQRTDIEAGPNNELDDSVTGMLFDAGLRRRWERTEFRIAGGRSIEPSSTGFMQEVDRVRVNLRHQIQPRWYAEFAGIAQTTDAADDETPFNERDYYQLRAGLSYQLTRDWSIDGSYSYAHQDDKNTPGSASSNEIFIFVNYQPQGRVW